jgi:hypothetical protein
MGGRRRKIRESCPKDLGNLLESFVDSGPNPPVGITSFSPRSARPVGSRAASGIGPWRHVVPFMFEMDFREETGDEIGLMKTAQGR